MVKLRNPIYLFGWFLKYTFFYFNDGYDLHEDIKANFSEFLTEEELEEKKQVLRDTPGPAGIKYALFVGYKLGGFIGALCAVLGVLLPIIAFTGIFILLYDKLKPLNMYTNQWIGYFFNGMGASALGLIVAQMIKSATHNKTNRRTLSFILPFALVYVFGAGEFVPVYFNLIFFAVMALSAVIVSVVHLKMQKRAKERKNDPNYFVDPYSKKAIKARDRKLREDEEELKKAAAKEKEKRFLEEKARKKKEDEEARKRREYK